MKRSTSEIGDGGISNANASDKERPVGWLAPLFEAAFTNSPDGIIIAAVDTGVILAANRTVRHQLGYEPAALVGTALTALEKRDDGRGRLLEEVCAHDGLTTERILRRIDGSGCLLHVSAAKADTGTRSLVIVTLRDVRDRKRAEAARREAEKRYRGIFENAIEGIFQTTPDGTYLSANPALARMYGYASPAALMAGLTDIAAQLYVDPARRAEFRRLLEQHDAVHGFESEIRRRDGTVTWISENARAVRDDDGVLRYYEGTVIDISARKRAEAAERDEAAVAAALAAVGRELMASIDSPDILTRLCELSAGALGCDWAHTLLWQTERDEYVAVSSAGALPPTRPASIPRSALATLIAALDEEDVLIVDAAGSERLPAAVRALQSGARTAIYFAVRRAGVYVGVLMAGYRRRPEPFTDVQRRIARGIAHLASVALEHARVLDELARASRIKSEFVATMSHELRTPLNIMLGYNELLQDDQFGALTGEQRDVLARIARSGRELLSLVTATLDLSRLESGTMPFDVGIVDLPALFAELDTAARELVRAKPTLRVEWDVADSLPVLQTDGAKLKVILKNLIHNAIKFSERGRVAIAAAPSSDGIAFTVDDTGGGMAPEVLPIIFEPFRQVDGSPTRRHDGVGLGLHVVRRLTELLGGTVGVESTVGGGSRFTVRIPSRETAPDQVSSPWPSDRRVVDGC